MFASAQSLIDAANAAVPRISSDEARALVDTQDALVLDVRDPGEIALSGKLSGALNIPHGEVPFRADPASPHHLAAFRKDRPVILYCASGRRSALDGHVLKRLGYDQVYNLGGFRDGADAGWAVEAG